MWAGGRVEFLGELRAGDPVRRTSTILKIEDKTGSLGRLVFVTVRHEIEGPPGLCIAEEHDIVYRGAEGAAVKPAEPAPAPAGGLHPRRSARPCAAVPLLGPDRERPSHPLRPRLRDPGGGLSRAGRPRSLTGDLARRHGPPEPARRADPALRLPGPAALLSPEPPRSGRLRAGRGRFASRRGTTRARSAWKRRPCWPEGQDAVPDRAGAGARRGAAGAAGHTRGSSPRTPGR